MYLFPLLFSCLSSFFIVSASTYFKAKDLRFGEKALKYYKTNSRGEIVRGKCVGSFRNLYHKDNKEPLLKIEVNLMPVVTRIVEMAAAKNSFIRIAGNTSFLKESRDMYIISIKDSDPVIPGLKIDPTEGSLYIRSVSSKWPRRKMRKVLFFAKNAPGKGSYSSDDLFFDEEKLAILSGNATYAIQSVIKDFEEGRGFVFHKEFLDRGKLRAENFNKVIQFEGER